jgi:hypothetical protein
MLIDVYCGNYYATLRDLPEPQDTAVQKARELMDSEFPSHPPVTMMRICTDTEQLVSVRKFGTDRL